MSAKRITVRANVERKDRSLPRFVVVPSEALAAWHLDGTTVVEARANETDLGRRTLKRWEKRDCWFLTLTRVHCRKAGLTTGDPVRLELERASEDPPREISDLVASDPSASSAWRSLSSARRRQLAEHVRAGKRRETRLRRARKALAPGEDGC